MDTLLSIAIGISLSVACGFRVFVPPLVLSIAAIYGHVPLSPDFQWIGTYHALIAFAVATLIEIAAYYIPWLDNLLDTISIPGAVAVGTYITAALVPESDPLLKWTIAVIAGGGSAGIVQALTGMTRFSSTALTGGFGNPIVATIEVVGAIILSVMAVFVPILAIALVITGIIFLSQKVLQRRASIRESEKVNITP